MLRDDSGFEHLHLHTHFSLLDGFGFPDEYAARAKKINQRFLCVSDHGMMGAIPSQIRACEQNGITPIFAVELYLNDKHPPKDIFEKMPAEEKRLIVDANGLSLRKSYHLLAIAINNAGYRNLVQLCSWGFLNGYYYRPRVTYDIIKKHKEGIIFTSCCYNSEIGQTFDRRGRDAAMDVVKFYHELFGENFYLELMLLDFEKQKPYDKFIIEAHDKFHIPLILTNDCLVRGTVITTKNGSKLIEDVTTNDEVLTHENVFKKVQFVNKRKLNDGEKVYRVKSRLGTFAWEATGNHLVRVASVANKRWNIKRKEIKDYGWKKVEDLTDSDYLIIPKIKKEYVFSDQGIQSFDLIDYVTGYVESVPSNGHVNLTNKLLFDGNFFVSHHGWSHKNTIKVPRHLKVDDDLLRVIGLYIAEGGVETNGTIVNFGLHKDEEDERNLVLRYFGQFGIKINERLSGNACTLKFSSVLFRQFFESLCGKGSVNKRLPIVDGEFFGVFSERQVKLIISQYYKGDGSTASIHERPSMIGSTSKKLIYDLSVIFNSLGLLLVPSIRDVKKSIHKNPKADPLKWNPLYCLHFGGNQKIKFENLILDANKKIKVGKKVKSYIDGDDCFAVKVSKVIVVDCDDCVYNLQVADHESYTANLFQVHNCHYCDKEDSLYQRYMLMIQTDSTLQDIEKKLSSEDKMDIFELQDSNLWMKSEIEINAKWREKYSDIIPDDLLTQAKLNTVAICERAKVEIDRSSKLPEIPDADDKLLEEVIRGLKQRGLNSPKYRDRLKEEVSLISRKGFSSYFLIQKQMTDEARRVCRELLGWGAGDDAVGPGRGSAVGSLVCYCLGITDVDPIKHGLLFSRFLSENRGGKSMRLQFSQKPVTMN